MDAATIMEAVRALPRAGREEVLRGMLDMFPRAEFVSVDEAAVRRHFRDMGRADRPFRLRHLTPSVIRRGMAEAVRGDHSDLYEAAWESVVDAVSDAAVARQRRVEGERAAAAA